MDDLKNTGFWIAVIGAAGTIFYNFFNYMRNPAFVRRSRLDDAVDTLARLEKEVSALRSENTELKSQVRSLMTECEFWRNEWRELKLKTERGGE